MAAEAGGSETGAGTEAITRLRGRLAVSTDEGGLGDAVLDALAESGPLGGRVVKLGVREMPGSGTPEELRAWAGIDAEAIVSAVTDAVG